MMASRRLINLAGLLLVLIALVAGTMLTALPIYLEARDRNAQEQIVAASNQLLQSQIDALRSQEAAMPQTEQELADLHRQLPGIPQLDDVIRLVVRASGKVNAAIDNVGFGSYAPFAARAGDDLISQLPQTATGLGSAAGDPAAVATDDDQAPADTAADGTTPATPDSASPQPTTADQLQFPVTISVTVADQAAASRFLDELRAGPRLLQIDTVNATTGEAGAISLTVTGLVFVSLS